MFDRVFFQDYTPQINQNLLATPSSENSDRSIMNEFIEETDKQLALRLQEKERKALLSHDYMFASSLQERENSVGQIIPRPPPGPPPLSTLLPLQQIPYKISPKQIVLSQVKKNRLTKLKPVETVVKKPFRVGGSHWSCDRHVTSRRLFFQVG